jgi:Tol biopolymer transport system component
MPGFKIYFFFFVLASVVSCSMEKATKRIPIENFFNVPINTSYLISPDGKYISYLKPDNNRIHIYVETLDGKTTTQLTCDSNRSIANYFWASNNEILYLKGASENMEPGLFAVNIDGNNKRELLSFPNTKIRLISSGPLSDGQVLVSLNKRDSTVFDAYRLNMQTGKLVFVIPKPR